MAGREVEKAGALSIAAAVIVLRLCLSPDWETVGIYAGCPLSGRLLYSFFHAGILHAVLNAWCLLSISFVYGIRPFRLILSYIIAVTAPVGLFPGHAGPTVGLSAMVYFLFGSISFEVGRRMYYQAWMAAYLILGFLFPNASAWLHLWCYLCGLAWGLLNKPIGHGG